MTFTVAWLRKAPLAVGMPSAAAETDGGVVSCPLERWIRK